MYVHYNVIRLRNPGEPWAVYKSKLKMIIGEWVLFNEGIIYLTQR